MRIKNMPRFILSMTILFTLIAMLSSLITSKVFSYEEPKYEKTIICSGDTLWKIASQYDGNIHKNIYEIKKINHMTTSDIYVGQELLIPVH